MVRSNVMATVRIVTGGMSHGKVRYQMKIVIDISEDVYTRLFDNGIQDNEIAVDDVCEMARAIRLGTPLPKHGKLVDISKIDEDRIERDNPIIYLTINGEYIEAVSIDYLNSLSLIIESSNSESEVE